MGNLEKRLAALEEFKNPANTRSMTDTELALRLYWACNGPDPIDPRLIEIIPQLASLNTPE